MGNKPIYKLSDYNGEADYNGEVLVFPKKSQERARLPLEYLLDWTQKVAPYLKIKQVRSGGSAQGQYNPEDYAIEMDDNITGKDSVEVLSHEMTHFLDSVYPLYSSVEEYSRPRDTLTTLIKYLSGRSNWEPQYYWNSPDEGFARAGEMALPLFADAVLTGEDIDERKIDSLAAGEHLRGESVITEPDFIRAMLLNAEFNRQPLTENPVYIGLRGEEETREKARKEAIERMKKFYAQTYKDLKKKHERGEPPQKIMALPANGKYFTKEERDARAKMIEEAKTGMNYIDHFLFGREEKQLYTPGYEYSEYSNYPIPYNGIDVDGEMVDWSPYRKPKATGRKAEEVILRSSEDIPATASPKRDAYSTGGQLRILLDRMMDKKR